MALPTLLTPGQPVHDIELLRLLRGRRLCLQLQTLCVIGAHRLDELPLINKLFPGLRRIVVFEPLPAPLLRLRALAAADPRITQAVYAGSRLLVDIEALLAPRFVKLGFAPMRADVPMHGNAVFVAQADVHDALAYTLPGQVRLALRKLRQRLRRRP